MQKLRQEEINAYKMISPYVVFVIIFLSYLLSINIISSFKNSNGGFSFTHYSEMIHDPLTLRLFFNTTVWTVGSVAGQFVLGYGVALLLQRITKGVVFFRSVIFLLPWVTLDIVAGVTWKWMYNDLYGVINDIFMKIGIINEPISWLGDKDVALIAVIIANIWKGFSLAGIFILARLQTIPTELYEAAEIDGASRVQSFFNITIPQTKNVSLSTLLLMVIWTINYFPLIFILTQGGPNFATETFVTYIYRIRFRFLENGLAASFSNVLFIVILIVSFVFMSLNRKDND